MNQHTTVTLALLAILLATSHTLIAQDARHSRADKLRALDAENIREIDGQLSYVNLKRSRFSDDSADLIDGQRSIVFLSVAETKISDNTLRVICKLDQLKWLFLDGTNITDEVAIKLQQLPNLRTLSVRNTAIGDKAFTNCEWKNLTTLNASDSNITDKTVNSISKLKQIHTLKLSGTKISDKCIENLIALSELTRLELSDTAISDEGFAKLSALSELRELDVTGTSVSSNTIEAFVKKLPNCLVHGPKPLKAKEHVKRQRKIDTQLHS